VRIYVYVSSYIMVSQMVYNYQRIQTHTLSHIKFLSVENCAEKDICYFDGCESATAILMTFDVVECFDCIAGVLSSFGKTHRQTASVAMHKILCCW